MIEEIDHIDRNEIDSIEKEIYAINMKVMLNFIENDTIDDMMKLYVKKGYINFPWYVYSFTNEDYESEDRIFKYMNDLWKETTNEKRIVK